MLNLASDTPDAWVHRALDAVDTILLDHAHCEKKAASTAINLIFRYQMHDWLMRPMSEIAREELEHFEQMLTILAERGVPFGPLEPSPYARKLRAAIRGEEPERLLDTLLCCSLIESRSCERMKRLADACPDPELSSLYRSLLTSEARHHHTYVDLALQRWPRDVVLPRLAELAAHEAAVIAALPTEPRMHNA